MNLSSILRRWNHQQLRCTVSVGIHFVIVTVHVSGYVDRGHNGCACGFGCGYGYEKWISMCRKETVPMYSMSLLECTPEQREPSLYITTEMCKSRAWNNLIIITWKPNRKNKSPKWNADVTNVICLWIVLLFFFLFSFRFSTNWLVIVWLAW